MKTNVVDKKEVQGATNNTEVKNNIRPSLTGKEAKNETAQSKVPAQNPQDEKTKAAGVKAGDTAAMGSQPAKPADAPKAEEVKQAEQAQQQAEPSKKELKDQLAEKQAHNLENTVKIVEQLSKKIAQKNKLSNTISNLDSFTVAQHDDKDDVASDSRFARCELVITDDAGNEFVTKNPYIIGLVVHDVKEVCLEKLAEVEASIVIP